jgi:transcriptional regulator with XRE-family HTH domain
MSSRRETLSRLLEGKDHRASYIRAKLNQLIPSQIRALRLSRKLSQLQLGDECDMKQSRISAAETPGGVSFSLETLIRFAAAFRVGLQVRFVPYSDLLDWENGFSQDGFVVTPIEEDARFLAPEYEIAQEAAAMAAKTGVAGQAWAIAAFNDMNGAGIDTGNSAASGGYTGPWLQ